MSYGGKGTKPIAFSMLQPPHHMMLCCSRISVFLYVMLSDSFPAVLTHAGVQGLVLGDASETPNMCQCWQSSSSTHFKQKSGTFCH